MIDNKPPFFSLIADLDYALELTRLHEKVPSQFYEEPKSGVSPYNEMLLNLLQDNTMVLDLSREQKNYDLPRFDNKDFPDMEMVIQDPNFDCDFIYKGRLYFSKQVREKFSFKGVALAALSGGVGGGVGSVSKSQASWLQQEEVSLEARLAKALALLRAFNPNLASPALLLLLWGLRLVLKSVVY